MTQRRDPVVGVDFDDAEHLAVEASGLAGGERETREDEALSAGRDDGRRHRMCTRGRRWPAGLRSRRPDRVGSRRSRPADDRRQRCRRPASPPWRPSRGPRSAPEALVHLACRVFQSSALGGLSWSNRASAASRSVSSKTSQRLIRSPSTVQKLITAPLGVEALVRGPMRHRGDDCSKVVQPMHNLDRSCACPARGPTRHGCMRSSPRARTMSPAGGRC